jgi:hypothetical protein
MEAKERNTHAHYIRLHTPPPQPTTTLGVLHDINAIGEVNIALEQRCNVLELRDYFTDLWAITTRLGAGEVPTR